MWNFLAALLHAAVKAQSLLVTSWNSWCHVSTVTRQHQT